MMSTRDVIYELLDEGWRPEWLGGPHPVLTNAPSAQRLCVECGKWRFIDLFILPAGSVCQPCRNYRSTSCQHRKAEREVEDGGVRREM